MEITLIIVQPHLLGSEVGVQTFSMKNCLRSKVSLGRVTSFSCHCVSGSSTPRVRESIREEDSFINS